MRHSVADWLKSAYPAGRLHTIWIFLIARTGMDIPGQGARSLVGVPLVQFSPSGGVPLVAAPNDAAGIAADRRARAQHYLVHHKDGQAITAAITSWFARAGAADPAIACPAQAAGLRAAIAAGS